MKAPINIKKDCKCIGGINWSLRQKAIDETIRIDQLHTKVFCYECGGYLGYLDEGNNFKRDTRSKSIKRQGAVIAENMREEYATALNSAPSVAVNVTIDPEAYPLNYPGNPVSITATIEDPTAEPSVVNGQNVPIEPIERNEYSAEQAQSFLQQSEIAARVVDLISGSSVAISQQEVEDALRVAMERVSGIRTSAWGM